MRYELKAYALRALAFFLILEAMLVGAILYFPKFEENIESLRAMAPLDVLKGLVDQLEQGGVAAYVVGQHFFKGCNTLGTAAAVLFAVGAVAGEANRGTLEIWLARPVSRTQLLLERYVLGWLALFAPILASSLSVPLLLDHIGERMDVAPLVWGSLHETLLLGAIYSLAFLCSTLGRNPTKIAFLLLFACTFEFSIYLVMELTHFSIFRLADLDDFQRLVNGAGLDGSVCAPLLAVNLALAIASVFAFRRRLPA